MALTLDSIDLQRRIHHLVWTGFHPDARIVGVIIDKLADPASLNGEDRQWIETESARVCADKHAAERSWPAQTEYDQIDLAFVQLRKDKFIALHPDPDSHLSGQQHMQSVWRAAGGFDSGIRGACFYQIADVEQALDSRRLTLAFSGGMIPESNRREDNSRLAARRILEALRSAKLLPVWNGNLSARIELPMDQWRKRAPLA